MLQRRLIQPRKRAGSSSCVCYRFGRHLIHYRFSSASANKRSCMTIIFTLFITWGRLGGRALLISRSWCSRGYYRVLPTTRATLNPLLVMLFPCSMPDSDQPFYFGHGFKNVPTLTRKEKQRKKVQLPLEKETFGTRLDDWESLHVVSSTHISC